MNNPSFLDEVIHNIRRSCLENLKDTKTAMVKRGKTIYSEVLITKDGKSRNALDFERVDFVDKESTTIHSPSCTFLNFDPIEFKVNKLSVKVEPFLWDSCTFHTNKMSKQLITALTDYYGALADLDDSNKDNREGFLGVAHSLKINKDNFVIDFGSSEIVSFYSILSILEENGIENVTVTSKLTKSSRK